MSEKVEEAKTFLKTISLIKGEHLPRDLKQNAHNLINDFTEEGDEEYSHYEFYKAIGNYDIALKVADAIKEYKKVLGLNAKIASIYTELKDYDLANQHFEAINELLSDVGDAAFGTDTFRQKNLPSNTSQYRQIFKLVTRYYKLIVIATLLLVILVCILVAITKNPLILMALQIPILILYIATHYFFLEEKGNNSA